ncbi:hypothetical protein [Saccharothrix syringae]|uniref:Uncharacterized protein n=1 Tax=Saccharothrix syringae TaxID=103733 RepID=A0A5Q0H2W5_SACSY|nr:hypothetical protein [Saccharothrix syringae]QFZ20558.1 hypothetical protein EKG83_26935 [Saccharothrix syringae]
MRLYLREVFAQVEALAFHTTMVKEGRFSLDLIRSPHPGRLVWINPQVRGPQDKPLKTGHTVHVWDRPTNQ